MSVLHKIYRGIRGPRCHLTPKQKVWVEERLLWLRSQFGHGPIRRPPLEPSSALLPRKWDCSSEAGADLLSRLCDFMLVDRARLKLEYFFESETRDLLPAFAGDEYRSGPAGLFVDPEDNLNRKLVIALEESGLERPANLAATICHELGHVHLLADGRIPRDAQDSEPLTDLLTVYFGAGIFTANAAFEFTQWQSHSHHGWSTRRHGYLSEEEFGYALACYAWYRGELKPKWARHLRANILYYFDDSLHFLSSTRDSTIPFDPRESEPRTIRELHR